MNIYRTGSLKTSREIARARAKLTVSSDRLECVPDELQQMQDEIVNILSKYMKLDEEILEVRMEVVRRMNRGVQDVKTIQIK